MKKTKKIENTEVTITKNENVRIYTKDDYNFKSWFYYMLLSLTNFYNVYMEIETSEKNIVKLLHINITSKKKLKKFLTYFRYFLVFQDAKVKISLCKYCGKEEKDSIFFSYNNEKNERAISINVNFEDLTFLLKKMAELSLSSKIAFVKFRYCFLDTTTKEIVFSEYDSEKINDYCIKDINNIDNIFITIGNVKENDSFTLYFK